MELLELLQNSLTENPIRKPLVLSGLLALLAIHAEMARSHIQTLGGGSRIGHLKTGDFLIVDDIDKRLATLAHRDHAKATLNELLSPAFDVGLGIRDGRSDLRRDELFQLLDAIGDGMVVLELVHGGGSDLDAVRNSPRTAIGGLLAMALDPRDGEGLLHPVPQDAAIGPHVVGR